MTKYIIKNCPAFTKDMNRYGICYDDAEGIICKCECRSDCLIKQIYEELKNCNCELINYLEIEEAE